MTDKEEVKEEIRKEIKIDLKNFSRVNDARKIGRFVDSQPLEKCVVSQYAQYNRGLNKIVNEADDIEKNRSRYGSGYHPAEIPLNKPFEQIYFNLMGKGINNTANPSKIGEWWECPGCHTKLTMSMKLAPETCPICGRLTPRGELNRFAPGWYKR